MANIADLIRENPELGEPLVPIPEEGMYAIGLANLAASIAGVVLAQPALVIGSGVVGIATAQLAAPRNVGIGLRVGALALPTVVVSGLLAWWALARRNAKKEA